MRSKKVMHLQHSQKGVVLVVSLIFLLLISYVATTVTQTSVMEVMMSGNQQFNEEAKQAAEALGTAIMSNENNFVIVGDVGYTNCGAGLSGCNQASINVPSVIGSATAGVLLEYYTERMSPLIAPFNLRLSEENAFGASSFEVASFEVIGRYDGANSGFGRSEIAIGALKRIASSQQ